jgi:hypothetical protein
MGDQLKILWLATDRSMRVTGSFDYFREAVSRLDGVEVHGVFKDPRPMLAGRWSKMMMKGKIHPPLLVTKSLADKGWDFVMIDAMFGYMEENLDLIKAPKGFVIEDNHGKVPKWQVENAHSRGVEYLFHRGYESFHRFHPTAREKYKCRWLTFAANTEMFYPMGLQRSGILQAGACGAGNYPVRAELIQKLSGWDEYTYIKRPAETPEKTKKWPIREDFAKVINQAHIFLTCGSKYDAAVQKYFEVPACETLLMSNWFKDLDTLGFENGKNIVIYEEDVRSQLELMLKDIPRLRRIAKRGKELILQRHTVEIRAKQFIAEVIKIVNENS